MISINIWSNSARQSLSPLNGSILLGNPHMKNDDQLPHSWDCLNWVEGFAYFNITLRTLPATGVYLIVSEDAGSLAHIIGKSQHRVPPYATGGPNILCGLRRRNEGLRRNSCLAVEFIIRCRIPGIENAMEQTCAGNWFLDLAHDWLINPKIWPTDQTAAFIVKRSRRQSLHHISSLLLHYFNLQ